VWPLGRESDAFTAWRRSLGLEGPYIVVQGSADMRRWRAAIEQIAASLGVAIVVLPICWCHGDRADAALSLTGRVFPSRAWLGPVVMSEILGRAQLVVASSLHACITAISYGVPAARVPIYWGPSKFDLLAAFTGVADIDQPAALARLVARERGIEPLAIAYADQLDRFWEMVCDIVRRPPAEVRDRATGTMLRWAARACGGRSLQQPRHRARVWVRDVLSRHLGKERMMLRRWLSAGFGRRQSTPNAVTARVPQPLDGRTPLLNIQHLAAQTMQHEPFRWAFIDGLFSSADAAALSATFPRDMFKTVKGHDGEKDYEYMSRSLIHMGADEPTHSDGLSPAWRTLAADLLSDEYRAALSRLTGCDLISAPMEVNVVHYGPGAWLGPHLDLKEKIVTHVLYFNDEWDPQLGGCLNILRSSNPNDTHATIPPIVGNSVLLVRSKQSWHSVTRVVPQCQTSRRSVNVIFHLPGSVSTMWPPGKTPELRDFTPA
jgi:SM-20-related protein